jgi:hypothetical protein
MTCPPPIATSLLAILQHGILCARAAGWSGEAERCAIETDHIHNLPELIENYSPERLRYYWDAERRSFMSNCSADELASWLPLWQRLQRQAEVLHDSPLHA